MHIERNDGAIDRQWNDYISRHPHASVYHHTFFRDAVARTYGHAAQYLAAIARTGDIAGVLPCFLLRTPFAGRELVSLPFCDYGGILADSHEAQAALASAAIELARRLRARRIELRQTNRLDTLPALVRERPPLAISESTAKVRMRLPLCADPDELFATFPSKLRSQIRKPVKQGLRSAVGGLELLDDFYTVFLRNMRDLGSPVHSRNLMKNVLRTYTRHARLFVVYKESVPVAASLAVGFRESLVNPWASFVRDYRRDAPNMMLYWAMLEYAAHREYAIFDFGRSTREESSYRFKEQWGAQPETLHWYRIGTQLEAGASSRNNRSLRASFEAAWRRMPVAVTARVGPAVRKYISL